MAPTLLEANMANVEHNAITDPNIHEPKGVSSASSGTVYVADGAGSGTWSTVGTKVSEVIVNDASDFPTAVSDVITLAADTVYYIDGDINVGNDRFVLSSNTQLLGYGSTISTITSTTTGNLFTASSSFTLDNFAVTASSATIFACTGGAFESAYLHQFTINACSSVGTFTAWYSLFWDKGAVVSTTTGLTMAGACTIFILDLIEFIAGYTTAVDLGVATFNTCSFQRCGFGNASATNHILMAASSANINANKEGRIYQCNFDAGATNIVNGFDAGDLQWESRGNLNLPNSTRNAHAYMHTTTTTTIGVGDGDSGNPKLVNGGTNWVVDHDDQFTVTSAGRFTYNGLTTAEFKCTCNISGTTASGTQTISHYLAKNGTVVTGTKTNREYTSTAVGSPAPSAGIITMSNGDYIELFLENETGTNDWDSYILNMTIIEVL